MTTPISTLISQEKFEHPAPIERQKVVHHKHYSLSFNIPYGLASWVAYDLKASDLQKNVEIDGKITQDPKLPGATAEYKDYKKSDFEAGHLVPPRDMAFSEEALNETFYITNIAAQKPGFSGGVWKTLEGLVRYWAASYDSVYVITGPVLTEAPFQTIGKNKVSVPKTYYKVIMSSDRSKAVGFLISNRNSVSTLASFAVPVDKVEEITNIDFFPMMEDEKEEKVESEFNKEDWIWETEVDIEKLPSN